MSEGGGEPVILTADLVAHAVIAAAKVFGDDPVKALTARRGPMRRCVRPAADGLARALDIPLSRAAGVLGCALSDFSVSRQKPHFEEAATAAMRAVEFALPEDLEDDDAEDEDLPALDDLVAEAEAGEQLVDAGGCAPPIVVESIAAYSHTVETVDDFGNVERTIVSGGLKRSAPGGIMAAREPPRPQRPNPTPYADRPVTDLVLEALADGPHDSLNLASIIDRKEMAVVGALHQLRSERKVVDEPVKSGPRKFRWRLVA